MKKAMILIGVSGSGKSTFRDTLEGNWEFVERDFVREILASRKVPSYDQKWDNLWSVWKWKWESEVDDMIEAHITESLLNGANIVFSDTNLDPLRVFNLTQRLESCGYIVEQKILDTPLMECIERDKARKNTVGEAVIYKQYMKLVENWNVRRRYQRNHTNPMAILVDLDGTLGHMEGKRGPFEWDKVHLDVVDKDTRDIVNMYHKNGLQVIILSGRDSECYNMTEQWLKDNNIQYDRMFMRAMGDQRKDWIVKEELFWKHIEDNYNIHLVIDDRKQVVMNTWHPLGLKVIQMGNAYLDF